MSIILSAILILVFLKIIRDSLFFMWLWQIKMYRFDRMKAYFRDEGIGSIIFSIFAFHQIFLEIRSRTLKRPQFTFRVLFTFFIIFVFYLIGFLFTMKEAELPIGSSASGVGLLFLYFVTPVLIALIILSTNPFFNFQKKRIIKKASLKMRGLKKVKVIGITGSYGKTSTKEFLDTILSEKYKVVKTEGNNNTNIGVARTVLNKVSDNYDYFICEMGAYKIGEIKEMCNIVKPEIGILTGINEQHLDLFGSIENTRKAKFELVESLPKDGMAIINKSIKYQVLSIKAENIKYFDLNKAENIKVCQDCVEFDYLTTPSPSLPKEGSIKFKANLFGKHYIENILSAIITAESLGMSLEEISKAVEKIKPSKFMMRKLDGPNSSIFIDDSYSANPDGVVAALDYLNEAYQDYKKIIVFPGIIELGEKSEEVHQKLFSRIDKVCDFAYILNIEYSRWLHSPHCSGAVEPNCEPFAERLHSSAETMEPTNKCEFIFEKDFGKVAEMLKNNLDEKTVVLFESRGAGVVMGKIM